jgi:hypothetical protein
MPSIGTGSHIPIKGSQAIISAQVAAIARELKQRQKQASEPRTANRERSTAPFNATS